MNITTTCTPRAFCIGQFISHPVMYSRLERDETRRTHCSLSSSRSGNTSAVSVAPRISFVSVSAAGCRTTPGRRSFSDLISRQWRLFSRPRAAAERQSTLPEIVSPARLLTYVFFFSPLQAERSGRLGLDACSSLELRPLLATPAGLV